MWERLQPGARSREPWNPRVETFAAEAAPTKVVEVPSRRGDGVAPLERVVKLHYFADDRDGRAFDVLSIDSICKIA